MSSHGIVSKIAKLWKKRSATITEEDPTFKAVYLGNTITQWAKGDGSVDKPVATLWRNYCQSTKPDIEMRVTVSVSGLKAVTREHGLTEYWSHRLTYAYAHPNYPKVFCWIYRHEGRKLKQELRCHAILCTSEAKAQLMQRCLRDRLHQALVEFRKEKQLRQNARLSVVSVLYPSTPHRKVSLTDASSNYRPPLERSKSAPKLGSIREDAEGEQRAAAEHLRQRLTTINSTASDPGPSPASDSLRPHTRDGSVQRQLFSQAGRLSQDSDDHASQLTPDSRDPASPMTQNTEHPLSRLTSDTDDPASRLTPDIDDSVFRLIPDINDPFSRFSPHINPVSRPNTDTNDPAERPTSDTDDPARRLTPDTDDPASRLTPSTDDPASQLTLDTDDHACRLTPNTDGLASPLTPNTDRPAHRLIPDTDDPARRLTPDTDYRVTPDLDTSVSRKISESDSASQISATSVPSDPMVDSDGDDADRIGYPIRVSSQSADASIQEAHVQLSAEDVDESSELVAQLLALRQARAAAVSTDDLQDAASDESGYSEEQDSHQRPGAIIMSQQIRQVSL